MLRRLFGLTLLVAVLSPPAQAQTIRGDVLYRVTLLRAAPGRLLDLVGALKAGGLGASASKSWLLRHSQGDHWDVMVLQSIAGYGQALKNDRPVPLAPLEHIAWQEEEFVRGPDLDALCDRLAAQVRIEAVGVGQLDVVQVDRLVVPEAQRAARLYQKGNFDQRERQKG